MSAKITRRAVVSARRAPILAAAVIASLTLLTACGHTAGAGPQATATATVPLPSPTPTLTATPTPTATATSGPTATTCQPDPYGFYSSQTSFVTSLTDAPFAAPPRTKHGLGSAGNNGTVTEGGESGVCTIGSFTTVTAFYTGLLPALGWQFSAPPAAITACLHGATPSKVWWKGSNYFAWYPGVAAGGGSIFWSYTYCSVHS
jgi:hypothetical protein